MIVSWLESEVVTKLLLRLCVWRWKGMEQWNGDVGFYRKFEEMVGSEE